MNSAEVDKQRAEIFEALGHPTRIVILKALSDGSMGFADLKKAANIDSSEHLQHHLTKLNGLIKTDEHGKYCLSDQGKDALLSVQTVEKAAGSTVKGARSISGRGWNTERLLKLVCVLLAVTLVVVSLVAAFEYSQVSQLEEQVKDLREALHPGSNVVWEHGFGVNIADFTVADSKVFTMTFDGDLYCFDQKTGQNLWSKSLGGYVMWNHLISVVDGKVFAGSRGSILTCLREDTGEELWRFVANVSSSIASKSPPSFSVAVGKVFMTADGFYVLNAADGKLLWQYLLYVSAPNFVGNWAVADDRVFAGGFDPQSGDNLYCFNLNDGKILWQSNNTVNGGPWTTGISVNSPPIVDGGRVFLWNYNNGSSMLCLDEFSGQPVWSFEADGTVFQPVISDGLLLFGVGNGNFYAFTEDGALRWYFESKHEISNSAAPKVINNKVLVGYEAGYVSALNLSDGKLVWRAPVSGNVASLETGNGALYVTSGNDLYSINIDNGNVQWKQAFNFWVLSPAYVDNKLYVAADAKVIAYG